MNLNAIPYAIPLLMVGSASIAIVVSIWPRRYVPGAAPFILLALAHSLWALGAAMRFLSAGLVTAPVEDLVTGQALAMLYPAQAFWSMVETVGILVMPAMAFAFALEYTTLKYRLPGKIWFYLLVEPAVAGLLLLTDPWHGLVGIRYEFDPLASFSVIRPEYGSLAYIHLLFSYAFLFLTVLMLARLLYSLPRDYKAQPQALLAALAFPWVVNVLEVSGLRLFAPLPLTPIAFIVTQFLYIWSVLRYRLLEIQPAARDSVIESLGDGIIMLDRQYRIVDLNPTARRIFGFSTNGKAKALNGQPVDRLIGGEYRELVEAVSTREEHLLEVAINEKGDDSPARTYEMRISPVYDWREMLSGYLIVLHDIADQKVLQTALYASEEKYRSVIERSNDGIVIVQDGLIAFANRQIAAMLGYTMDELRNTSMYQYIQAESAADVRERLEKRLRGELSAPRFETILAHRNGRMIDVEMSAGVMEYEHQPAMLVFIRDITGAKRSAEELDHSLALLQSAIQSTADGILVVDTEDGVITYNQRFVEMWRLPDDWVFSFDSDDRLEYLASQTTDPKAFRKRAFEMMALPEKEGHDQFTLTDGRVIERYATPYRVTVHDDPEAEPKSAKKGRQSREETVVAGKVWNFRDVTERRQAEEALSKANETLKSTILELEKHNLEVTLLGEMGNLLHSCAAPEEAYAVVAEFAKRLFPDISGVLYILRPEHNLVESVVQWGKNPPKEVDFPAERCWSLRRGRIHIVRDPKLDLNCLHIHEDSKDNPYICVPMIAQGETIGIFHLQAEPTTQGTATIPEQLTATVSESIAMSLANLRLRERLRVQSIRDPLTGLFNRRYMEESLELELSRARRYERKVGVIMIDLDLFKNFNDTYGHRAGDQLLKAFGEFLLNICRDEDIACRYGGEEFILILPEAGVENCRERAEEIRRRVKEITLDLHGEKVGFTISLGVAGFPDNGIGADAVVGAADAALYDAKHSGRDCVMVAKSSL